MEPSKINMEKVINNIKSIMTAYFNNPDSAVFQQVFKIQPNIEEVPEQNNLVPVSITEEKPKTKKERVKHGMTFSNIAYKKRAKIVEDGGEVQ